MKRAIKIPLISLVGLLGLAVGVYSFFMIRGCLYRAPRVRVPSKCPDLPPIDLQPKKQNGIRGYVAVFELGVPPRKAWKMLSRCEDLALALRGVRSCKTLSRDGDTAITRMRLRKPADGFMKNKNWYDNEKMISRWKLLDGQHELGKFYKAEGFVKLRAHRSKAGFTEVDYGYFLIASPFVPADMMWNRVRSSVKHMANEIQHYFHRCDPKLEAILEKDRERYHREGDKDALPPGWRPRPRPTPPRPQRAGSPTPPAGM